MRMRAAPSLLFAAVACAGCGRIGFDDPTGGLGGLGGSGGGGGAGDVTITSVGELVPVASVEIGTHVYRLVRSGKLVFVATSRPGAEVGVFDFTDPTRPQEIGAIATNGTPYDMAVSGDRLHVVTETGGHDLEIFDISDPRAAKKLGGISAADTAYRVAVQGGRAYVTSAAAGDDLEIFDVTTPASITKLGGIDLLSGYYVRGVVAAFPLVYTAGQRMNPIDVSNPAQPAILGDAGFYWYAYDLAVSGTRAIGLDSNNGNEPQLRVWDVSNPAAPVRLGMSSIWDSYGRDVEVVGRFAFTVCAPGGYSFGAELEVWDISTNGNPPRVASFHLARDGYAVTVVGQHVIVGQMQSSDPELLVLEVR
jgi:hypothetical protein